VRKDLHPDSREGPMPRSRRPGPTAVLRTTKVLEASCLTATALTERAGLTYNYVSRSLSGTHIGSRGSLPQSMRKVIRELGSEQLEQEVLKARAIRMPDHQAARHAARAANDTGRRSRSGVFGQPLLRSRPTTETTAPLTPLQTTCSRCGGPNPEYEPVEDTSTRFGNSQYLRHRDCPGPKARSEREPAGSPPAPSEGTETEVADVVLRNLAGQDRHGE
jgi:hypothetical protein